MTMTHDVQSNDLCNGDFIDLSDSSQPVKPKKHAITRLVEKNKSQRSTIGIQPFESNESQGKKIKLAVGSLLSKMNEIHSVHVPALTFVLWHWRALRCRASKLLHAHGEFRLNTETLVYEDCDQKPTANEQADLMNIKELDNSAMNLSNSEINILPELEMKELCELQTCLNADQFGLHKPKLENNTLFYSVDWWRPSWIFLEQLMGMGEIAEERVDFSYGLQSEHMKQKGRPENPEFKQKPDNLSKKDKKFFKYHSLTETPTHYWHFQYSFTLIMLIVILLLSFVCKYPWWIFDNNVTIQMETTQEFSMDSTDLSHDTRCQKHTVLLLVFFFVLLLLLNVLPVLSALMVCPGIHRKGGWPQLAENGKFTSSWSSFHGENQKPSDKWYLNWSKKAVRGLQRSHWTFPVSGPGSLEKYFAERFNVSELSLKQEMKYEWKRFQSFSNWPEWAEAYPSELATEGFYYTNQADMVTCFSCDLMLGNFRQGRSVAVEHRNLSPACKFLLRQGENVPIFENEEEASTYNTNELLMDMVNTTGSNSTGQILTSIVSPAAADVLGPSAPSAPEVPQVFLDRMKQETLRITTYRNWPQRDKIDVRKLARAGFFYLGTESQVRCAFCTVALKTISPNDNPMEIHRSRNPNCPIFNVVRNDSERSTSLPVPATRTSRSFNTDSNLGIISDHPKHPEYATLLSRLNSFNDWNPDSHQTARDLAEAGFIHAGMSDCVKCFHCDGGLRNWLPGDVPWVEHARWFPECSHVRLNKGQSFIDTVNEVFPRRFHSGGTTGTQSARVENDSSDSDNDDPPQQIVPHINIEDNIDSTMRSPEVKKILDMGYSRNITKTAVENFFKKRETGVKLTAQSLLEIIFEMPETLLDANTIKSGSARVVESDYRTDEINPVIDGAKAEPIGGAHAEPQQAENLDTKTLREKNRELVEQTLCKICLENKMCITFLPCGHLVCCSECAPALRKCPICRSNIKGRVRVYMS